MYQRVFAPQLVGRQAQLAELSSLLAEACCGHGKVVLLAGEAGVGKTRLIEEFVHTAPAEVTVLAGDCFDEQPASPYGPFVDLLRRAPTAATLPTPAASHIEELQRAGIDQQLSASADIISERMIARRELFQSMYTALRPAAGRTHLIILEDLHWADEASLDLLHYLARASAHERLLILGSYRSDTIHRLHPLAGLISRLSRERRYHEILLKPLARPELATMLSAILGEPSPPTLTQALHEHTEGNPFFVEEVLGALINQGGLAGNAPRYDRVLSAVTLPISIKDTILRRVAALEPTAATVLRAAAVVGRRFDFDLLARLSGLAERELLQVLSDLVERQLIIEEPGGSEDCYRFRHELIRATLYEELLRRERRLRHKQVLDALEKLHAANPAAAADQLAYHARLARDLDAAVRYSTLTGDRAAAVHAYREAVGCYEDAIEAGDQRGWPAEHERASLLARLGRATYLLGDNQRSAAAWEDALEIYQRLQDRRSAGDMQRWLGRVAWDRGDVASAFTSTRAALDTLATEPPCAELAMAQSALAHLYMLQLHSDSVAASECIAWGQRALAMAETLGNDAVTCHALNSLGVALIDTGQSAEGLTYLERSLALAHAADLPIDIVRGYINLGSRLCHDGDTDRGLALLREGWAYVMRRGIVRGADKLLRLLTYSELDVGAWAEIERHLAEVQQSESLNTPEIQSHVRHANALIAWCQGHLSEARAEFEALCKDKDLEQTKLRNHREQLLARVLFEMGDYAQALQVTEQALPDLSRLSGLDAFSYASLAEILLHAGRLEPAQTLIQAMEQVKPPRLTTLMQTILVEIYGLAALDQDPAAAAKHFAHATTLFKQLNRPLDEIRLRRRYAEALIRSGVLQPALAELERARSAAAQLGYSLELMQIDQLRATLHAPVSRPATEAARPVDGLTPRELEVLTLITRGLSNRAIAETLVIAEKTAEVHVRNILSKLGLNSRTQAATYALERGLVATTEVST